MKKSLTKIISGLMALIMVVSIVPMSAITASSLSSGGICCENVYWNFNSSTGSLRIYGNGPMSDYFSGYESPFDSCSDIKSVTIEEGVTEIGYAAFYSCVNIESISLPSTVTHIWNAAFMYCNSLAYIFIPEGVTYIGSTVFDICNSLTYISVSANNTNFSNDGRGVLFNKDKTVLVKYPNGNRNTSYTIPSGVTTINEHAFADVIFCQEVIIPDTVTKIESSAFRYADIRNKIIIPDSVTEIGSDAFFGCFYLTYIEVDMNNQAYSNDIHGVLFDKDKTTLIQYPTGKNETSYIVPNGVTTINRDAFYYSDLKSIKLPLSLKKIEGSPFDSCDDLTDIYYDGSESQWNKIQMYSGVIPESVTIHYNHMHSYTKTITKDSTHLTEGEAKFTCVCGDSYIEPIEKTATHSYNAAFITEPTCTEQGYTTYSCECGDSYVDDYVDVIDHEYTSEITTPATHTSTGVMTFTCKCGDYYTEPIAKLEGHTYEAVITAPTCTEKGYTTYICACGDTYSEIIPATGHNLEEYSIASTSCIDIGYECYKCTYCGAEYVKTFYEALDHTPGEWEVVVAATCTEDGYRIKKCTVCEIELEREDIVSAGHNHNSEIIAEPTCTEDGLKRYTCSACDDSYDEVLPATGHTETTVRTEPTCLSEGSVQHLCEVCGETLEETEVLPVIPHSYEETIVSEPTCVADGEKYYTCSFCGDRYDEILPATGEHTIMTIRKEPTCTKIGTEQYICEVCGDMIGDLVILPKTDHTYGEWTVITVPTETEDGSKEHSCTSCGQNETNVIPSPDFSTDSGVTFDLTTRFVTGLNAGLSSLENYVSSDDDNYTWSYETQNGKLGTGSKATLKYGESLIGEYTILVYGDTNGDSWYDGQDAVLVSCLANGMLTKDDVSEAVYMAADCNHDGVIDQLDVELLNQAGTLLANVDQSKPVEVLLETSSEYVEYLDLIDQSPESEIEDSETTEDNDVATEDDSTETEESTKNPENSIVAIILDLISFIKNAISFILGL